MSRFLGRLGLVLSRLGKFQLGVAVTSRPATEAEIFDVPGCAAVFAPGEMPARFQVPHQSSVLNR